MAGRKASSAPTSNTAGSGFGIRSTGFCQGSGTGCSLRLESGGDTEADAGDSDGVVDGISDGDGFTGGATEGGRVAGAGIVETFTPPGNVSMRGLGLSCSSSGWGLAFADGVAFSEGSG